MRQYETAKVLLMYAREGYKKGSMSRVGGKSAVKGLSVTSGDAQWVTPAWWVESQTYRRIGNPTLGSIPLSAPSPNSHNSHFLNLLSP